MFHQVVDVLLNLRLGNLTRSSNLKDRKCEQEISLKSHQTAVKTRVHLAQN